MIQASRKAFRAPSEAGEGVENTWVRARRVFESMSMQATDGVGGEVDAGGGEGGGGGEKILPSALPLSHTSHSKVALSAMVVRVGGALVMHTTPPPRPSKSRLVEGAVEEEMWRVREGLEGGVGVVMAMHASLSTPPLFNPGGVWHSHACSIGGWAVGVGAAVAAVVVVEEAGCFPLEATACSSGGGGWDCRGSCSTGIQGEMGEKKREGWGGKGWPGKKHHWEGGREGGEGATRFRLCILHEPPHTPHPQSNILCNDHAARRKEFHGECTQKGSGGQGVREGGGGWVWPPACPLLVLITPPPLDEGRGTCHSTLVH